MVFLCILGGVLIPGGAEAKTAFWNSDPTDFSLSLAPKWFANQCFAAY
jgi:hypothetical protein